MIFTEGKLDNLSKKSFFAKSPSFPSRDEMMVEELKSVLYFFSSLVADQVHHSCFLSRPTIWENCLCCACCPPPENQAWLFVHGHEECQSHAAVPF